MPDPATNPNNPYRNRPQWEWPPVHPAADRLPMMDNAQIADLAADIKEYGLQEPWISVACTGAGVGRRGG